MATETNKVVTKNEITGDASQLLKEINRVVKASSEAQKQIGDIGKGFNVSLGTSQFKTIIKSFKDIQNSAKSLSKHLKTVQTQVAGISALTNKAAFKGAMDRVMYGTEAGQENQRLKVQQKEIRVKEQNVKMNREIQASQAGVNKETLQMVDRFQRLDATLGLTQLKLMANYAAMNTVIGGFKYLLNYTVQFDSELKQLQAISAVSNTGLQKLKTTIYEVANATKFTSLEVAKSGTVLAQAGLSVAQIQKTLPAIANLATATGTDLATSTDVITSVLNVYSLQVSEAEQVTNALTTAMNESKADIAGFQTAMQYAGNVAAQLGISYEETAAAIAAMTQAGIRSKSMLGTGLRAVLTEFLKPTKNLVGQLEKVGLTIEDIDVRSQGFTTVLKKLKDAGFGAAEAFRGMQRRGAAALAAMLGQTDFMDDLRLKMAGSTAAAKANETQMEALLHQWENFQSIMGSVAYEGLAPVISGLSSLLKVINNFMKGTETSIILSALFGATSLTAVTATVGVVVKSLASIGTALISLQRALKIISAGKGALIGITALTGLSSGPILAVVAGLGALAGALYVVGGRLGWFGDKADQAQAKLEETKGEIDEVKSNYEALNDVLDRLYLNREKLDNQAERDIFTREILSRFPEASKYINATAGSVEELIKVVEKLQEIDLSKMVEKTKQAAEEAANATQEIAKKAFSEMGNLWGNFSFLTMSPFTSFGGNAEIAKARAESEKDLKAAIAELEKVSGGEFKYVDNTKTPKNASWQRRKEDLGADVINQFREFALTQKSYDPESFVRTASTAINDGELKKAIDALAEEMRLRRERENAEYNQSFNENFGDIIKDLRDSSTKSIELYNENNSILKDVMTGDKAETEAEKELATRSIEALEASLDTFKDIRSAKTQGDLEKALNLQTGTLSSRFETMVKDNPTLAELDEEALTQKFARSFLDGLAASGIESKLADAIVSAQSQLGIDDQKSIKSQRSALDKQIKDKIKNLKSTQTSDLSKEKEDIRKAILQQYQLGLAGIGLQTVGDGLTGTETEALAGSKVKYTGSISDQNKLNILINQRDSQLKKLDSQVVEVTSSVDKTALKIDYFFKNLKARLKEIDDAYEESLFKLNAPLTLQEGRALGAERAFGSGSVITQAEQVKLSNMEKNLLPQQTALMKEQVKQYREVLKSLQTDKGYAGIESQYKSANERYEKAMAGGSAVEMKAASDNLNKVASNYYKYTEQTTSLQDKIRDLQEDIVKNTEALWYQEANENLSAKDPFSAVTTGMNAASTIYTEEQAKEGLTRIAPVVGKMTLETLNAAENGFADMFQTIINGSASAGEAFKTFGQSIVKTIADIATQMLAKQAVLGMMSFFGFGDTSGGASSWNPAVPPPSMKSVAQGGLITGPIKNRDSVPTQLMPGEYVLKKSAVDAVGRDYLDNLNNNASSLVSTSESQVSEAAANTDGEKTGVGGVVNVWVVSQEQQAQMSPSDVLVTVSDDMRKGGNLKKLVKQIAMGG